MVDDDFGIESLADYLHVDPCASGEAGGARQIAGRKVASQWRFSQAEIHHWLEERIGLSSDEELVHMEGALRRAAGHEAEPAQSIADLLPLEAIAIPLAAHAWFGHYVDGRAGRRNRVAVGHGQNGRRRPSA